MEPIITILFQFVGTLAGWVFFITAIEWAKDFYQPAWRTKRWAKDHEVVIHYDPRWQSWYAWRPVRTVQGDLKWLETVYRCCGNDYVDHDDWTWYHYGTIMDVLKDTK